MKRTLIANFGNESLSLMAWAIENDLSNVTVVYVDTGWSAEGWQAHIKHVKQRLACSSLRFQALSAPAEFEALVRDRKQFPSIKFQWCAGFLKGLAINAYLDEQDPECLSQVLLAKRKSTARANRFLSAFEHDNEYYNLRTVHYPLLEYSDAACLKLLKRHGLPIQYPRSLECQPCIHSTLLERQRMTANEKRRLQVLENEVGCQMFKSSCDTGNAPAKVAASGLDSFDRGCGMPWGCGT